MFHRMCGPTKKDKIKNELNRDKLGVTLVEGKMREAMGFDF